MDMAAFVPGFHVHWNCGWVLSGGSAVLWCNRAVSRQKHPGAICEKDGEVEVMADCLWWLVGGLEGRAVQEPGAVWRMMVREERVWIYNYIKIIWIIKRLFSHNHTGRLNLAVAILE